MFMTASLLVGPGYRTPRLGHTRTPGNAFPGRRQSERGGGARSEFSRSAGPCIEESYTGAANPPANPARAELGTGSVTSDEPVTLQLTGIGPWAIHPVAEATAPTN